MANFKASARSVDLLGRQQIAGIPNAINEIFKNAYDAYANIVRVDYIEEDNILFIRDDGYGMTLSDFENKWLILGTDSKTTERNNYIPQNGKRVILGEKGIGRLSIATIGSSVLIVSRANRANEISKIIVSYICWTLFEIPGISIDEIPIPVIEIAEMPDEKIVSNIVTQVKDFYLKIKSKNDYQISKELDNKIMQSLTISPFSPKTLSEQYINSDTYNTMHHLSLNGHKSGTHFYITPVDSILLKLLEKNSLYGKDLNDLQKQLLGFYPSFLTDIKPEMTTSFFIYRKDSLLPEDIISANEFLNTKDYEIADHHFEGKFDVVGTFHGKISIYDQSFDIDIPWTNSYGRIPKCGSFEIRIGYLQGKQNESKLSPMEFSYLQEKLNRVGGLYIYKDTIRILPYGDNDFDFLKLEKKRTLGASYYMFSLRRFIGAILLTSRDNQMLQEKAGREGFSKNQAYYDFISILDDFFDSILTMFLREKSSKRITDVYFKTKSELIKHHEIQVLMEERNKQIRKETETKLESAYHLLEKVQKDESLVSFENYVDESITEITFWEKPQNKIAKLEELKSKLLSFVQEKENFLYLEKPNVSMGQNFFLKYTEYMEIYNEYLTKTLYPFRSRCLKKIETSLFEIGNLLEQDINFQNQINRYYIEIDKFIEEENKEVKHSIQTILNNSTKWKDLFSKHFEHRIVSILKDVERPIHDTEQVTSAIQLAENLLRDTKKKIKQFYTFLLDDLNSINNLNPDDHNSYSKQETLIAQGESILELKKQLDSEYELFQLGTAISIIHHEFGQTADVLKQSIKELNIWASANETLQPLYKQLYSAYLHLENYIKLFTPLSKRKLEKQADVSGKEIFKYIIDLFGEKCKKDSIMIAQTDKFSKTEIHIDRSIILPVFINLVDNALFWVKRNSLTEGRKIQFDILGENDIIISDNGPGVPPLERSLIFERGYTTKPGGRGLGLFISKQILNECGFSIEVTKSQYGKGMGFVISRKEDIISE